MVSFAQWVEEEVLEEVPHRQYVFTIPKCLRIYFKYDRELLGDLSRGAYDSLKEFFRVAVPDEEATPGAIIAIQTFGEMLNFHPHPGSGPGQALHCLVTDGCFGKEGTFYRLPSLVDMGVLTDLFRHKVLPSLRSIANWKLESANLKISNFQSSISNSPQKGADAPLPGKELASNRRERSPRPWWRTSSPGRILVSMSTRACPGLDPGANESKPTIRREGSG